MAARIILSPYTGCHKYVPICLDDSRKIFQFLRLESIVNDDNRYSIFFLFDTIIFHYPIHRHVRKWIAVYLERFAQSGRMVSMISSTLKDLPISEHYFKKRSKSQLHVSLDQIIRF